MKIAQAILREELASFEKRFKEAVKSQVPLLDRIMQFIVNRKGKQMRPMFVLLSAKLCGPVNESAYRAASLVELLHTATLVHDDVVDESLERRGFFSTYALWKTKISVLVGDYLLSKGPNDPFYAAAESVYDKVADGEKIFASTKAEVGVLAPCA